MEKSLSSSSGIKNTLYYCVGCGGGIYYQTKNFLDYGRVEDLQIIISGKSVKIFLDIIFAI